MSKKIYSKEMRKLNNLAVSKHYKANAFEIQKKRKLSDIKKGMNVRIDTIIKYGLEKEAKKHGLKVNQIKSNPVKLLDINSKESNEIKKKIETKLNEYDQEIGKMIQAKVEMAKKVSKGQPRIESNKKITWSDMNTFIDQIETLTKTSKKGYRGTLKTMVNKIFKCKPDKDIALCFNNYQQTIKNIKLAKSDRTKKLYQSLGRFYSLPLTFAKYIPEFDVRFTLAAKKAYKNEFDKFIERNTVRQIEKHKEMVVDWKEILRSRKLWKEEYEETKSIKSLMGYTIMALYTYIPPLRNDFGCVVLVDKEPADKKRNYYWVKKGAFYLNHFKTMKRYPDSPPIIFPPILKNIVNEWIKKTKAKVYLFSKQNMEPYSGCMDDNKASSFANEVKKAASRFIQETGQPSITINVLRHSKATSMKGKSEDERLKTATSMRHSLSTASIAYMRTSWSAGSEQSEMESD